MRFLTQIKINILFIADVYDVMNLTREERRGIAMGDGEILVSKNWGSREYSSNEDVSFNINASSSSFLVRASSPQRRCALHSNVLQAMGVRRKETATIRDKDRALSIEGIEPLKINVKMSFLAERSHVDGRTRHEQSTKLEWNEGD